MLSVLLGEHPDLVKQLVEFYVPKGSSILDLTYGHGKLWSAIDRSHYDLVTNDVDPDSPAEWHVPFRSMMTNPFRQRFNLALYDPPYMYGRHSKYLLSVVEKDEWKPVKTKLTVEKQIELVQVLNQALPILLEDDGLLLVKIMNTRLKGHLILSNQIICKQLTQFEVKAEYVYIRTNTGFFRLKHTPQTAHGYYLVFSLIGVDSKV